MAARSVLKEFKEFIDRGNAMDLAVGVIIGGAFTGVVNALVDNVVRPFISFITGGGAEIPGLSLDLNGNVMDFGALISAVINFLITAAAVFAIIKAVNGLNDASRAAAEKALAMAGRRDEDGKDAAPTTKTCPFCMSEIDIRATRCPHCTSELGD
ncbi:MAG: large conductance mechanosensitive channel protein MscL [Collinsella sp.]|nr:large conductance mechanosensitive channel protein MscL [Collinsella sp.]